MAQPISVAAAVVAQLNASSALQALSIVGVFEVAAPPDLTQYPCISFAFVGGSAEEELNPAPAVLHRRLEVNGLALSYLVADRIRTAAVVALKAIASQACADGSGLLGVNLLNPGTDFVGEDRVFRCMAELYVQSTLPASA